MHIKFSWVLTRDQPKGKETVKYGRSVDPSDLPKSSEVERVLKGSFSSFRVYNIYPRYFRVTGSGEVRPFEQEVCFRALPHSLFTHTHTISTTGVMMVKKDELIKGNF